MKIERFSHHFFLHIVRRPKDFFKGVKVILENYPNIITKDFILDESLSKIIDEAEYAKIIFFSAASEIKILRRIKKYKKVFDDFVSQVSNHIEKNQINGKVYIYLADEGVWGEFIKVLKKIIERRYSVSVEIVNIQHGFFTLKKISLPLARKLFNLVLKTIIGYPVLGYGFGGSHLNNYIVYGVKEKEFVSKISPRSNVIVSPTICKYELIEQVNTLQSDIEINDKDVKNCILFAAQLNEINPDILFSEEEIAEKILPLFKKLFNQGYKVYYRLHPAIPDKDRYINLLKKYEILQYTMLDSESHLNESLTRVGTVMALQSTTLIDGYVVGRMPVIIRGLNKYFEFTTPHENIDLSCDLDKEIENTFENLSKYYKTKITLNFESEVYSFFNNLIKNN